MLESNEQFERLLEVGLVILVGGMLSKYYLAISAIWFVPLLFLIIRPISVCFALLGRPRSSVERAHLGWFGLRGIGSIYYLMFALNHDLPHEVAHLLTSLVLTVIAASIFLHGVSVTPIMARY